MKPQPGPASLDLDPLVHEKSRLIILTYLASSPDAETGFTELRDALGLSGGNLSIQLKNLEEAKYVATSKRFRGSKPFTGIHLTAVGHEALEAYLETMGRLVATVRKPRPKE